MLSSNIDLQREVGLLKELLLNRYGNGEAQTLFESEGINTVCDDGASTKLFNAIAGVMPTNDQVASMGILDEKKTVTIIYMSVFDQSPKVIGVVIDSRTQTSI